MALITCLVLRWPVAASITFQSRVGYAKLLKLSYTKNEGLWNAPKLVLFVICSISSMSSLQTLHDSMDVYIIFILALTSRLDAIFIIILFSTFEWIYERSYIWTAEKDIILWLIIAVTHTTAHLWDNVANNSSDHKVNANELTVSREQLPCDKIYACCTESPIMTFAQNGMFKIPPPLLKC